MCNIQAFGTDNKRNLSYYLFTVGQLTRSSNYSTFSRSVKYIFSCRGAVYSIIIPDQSKESLGTSDLNLSLRGKGKENVHYRAWLWNYLKCDKNNLFIKIKHHSRIEEKSKEKKPCNLFYVIFAFLLFGI